MAESAYERKRARAQQREAAQTAAGQDIGAIPPIRNSRRRRGGMADFRHFCESYFPQRFFLPWSPDHLTVLAMIQETITAGGSYALAMPRGSGKTSLMETACLWAILAGYHPMVLLIGSDLDAATDLLNSLKSDLEENARLAEDFPRAVYPIRCLEGSARRCEGQRYAGRRTHIRWTSREIALPMIPRSKAAGAVIRVSGLTGRFRGLKHTRPDGRTVRPTLVLLDDPQTDQSALSPTQSQHRAEIVAGAVLGLAGPGKKIAAMMPCTVIRPDDMADRTLDREQNPQWRGQRFRLVYEFPTDKKKLWEQYRRLRADGLREKGHQKAATALYRKHRKAMDAGARVAWPERFNPDQLSAIQYAMDLLQDDERAFWAEYQNQPLVEQLGDGALTLEQVLRKTSGRPRGEIPAVCEHLTAHIDVHDDVLYWVAVAWRPDFTGHVVDYGTFPDQKTEYFLLKTAKRTLRGAIKQKVRNKQAAILAGLVTLGRQLLDRRWVRDDGTQAALGLVLIDAGYLPETVREAIVGLGPIGRVLPARGRGITASNRPISEWEYKRGDRRGHYLGLFVRKHQRIRSVEFDANYYKSRMRDALAAAAGDTGSIDLFGDRPQRHRMFGEHCTAEYPVPTEGQGRRLEEWKLRPGSPDNHLWDNLVGCAVAASILGCQIPGAAAVRPRKKRTKRRVRYLND